MALKVRNRIVSSGFSVTSNEISEATTQIGLGQIFLVAGTTAAAMALGSIAVKAVEHYVFNDTPAHQVEFGGGLVFKSIAEAKAAREELDSQITAAETKAEKIRLEKAEALAKAEAAVAAASQPNA